MKDPGPKMGRLQVDGLGPIASADIRFGDLTTLVGPQATGKSILLQTLKLVMDHASIRQRLQQSDAIRIETQDTASFLQLVYGEGMHVWRKESSVLADGFRADPRRLARLDPTPADPHLFYIPAQRVMSLRDGFTRPFGDYKAGDPFVLRGFSQELHDLIQSDFIGTGKVFPKTNRLTAPLRRRIAEAIYGEFALNIEQQGLGRRFVLHGSPEPESDDVSALPFLVWSAGQREFTPLLLGLYWLLPPGGASKRHPIEWVVIEEPEMGLHPEAIFAVLSVVLELLRRGYRVVISTHSPAVLDLQWVLGRLQRLEAPTSDVRELLGLTKTNSTERLAERALTLDLRAYSFGRDGIVKDISTLDPGAEDSDVSGWGGLTGFSSLTGRVLARAVRRAGGPAR